MIPFKISAKNLGAVALEDFCPRCYYLRMKMSFKMPFSSFPGIFSSIDAFTKHCIHYMIDNGPTPTWMMEIGNVAKYRPVPHWSKNTYFDSKSQITLHGAPDDLLILADGTLTIPDYKTQRWTDNQDKLFPLYAIQSNVYNILMTQDTKIDAKLFLVYMEPDTAADSACHNIIKTGFSMCFNAKVVPVETNKSTIRNALTITRDIWEMSQPPKGREKCKDCLSLDLLMGLLK